jgi:hypothetical protein
LAKREIEDGYSEESSTVSYSDFIIKYNQLQEILYLVLEESDRAKQLAGRTASKGVHHNRVMLENALRMNGIFNNSLAKIYREIAHYRNALVHSTEGNRAINGEINQKLFKLYDLMNSLLAIIKTSKDSEYKDSKPYKDLVKFASENVLSKSEKEMIDSVIAQLESEKTIKIDSKDNEKTFYSLIQDGIIDDLLTSKQITQEQFSAISAWYSSREKA